MSSASYSFLDVAVLDAVRNRFAAGDALAVLSIDLEQLIWANGPGAVLLGHTDIESAIGAEAGLPLAARRQVMATGGFPAVGNDRSVMVRFGGQALMLQVSAVTLPDGERAIMLAAPAATGGGRSAGDIARRAIRGFNEAGHHVAFVDGDGRLEAASPGFVALGLDNDAVARMAQRLAGDTGRIAKRMLPGAKGPLPAGMARLTDDPVRHLLVVIDEAQEETGAPTEEVQPVSDPIAPNQAVADAAPAEPNTAESPPVATAAASDQTKPASSSESGHDSWYFSDATAGSDVAKPENHQPEHDAYFEAPAVEDLAEAEAGTGIEEPVTPARPDDMTAAHEAPATDTPEADISAAASSSDASPVEVPSDRVPDNTTVAHEAPTPNKASTASKSSNPVRFVWRTDAEGRFSQISHEFIDAVGAVEADVVGNSFADVAAKLGLDPSGEIAGLLERRDTWSGRSVLWPVAGTDLRIPVDLAALPVYSRTRTFEGFRGFGVARPSDAVQGNLRHDTAIAEPTPDTVVEEQAEPLLQPAPESEDPFRGEVPAISVEAAPDRRFTDKVIRLAEHRPQPNDKSLSSGERIAFQQIGERLKKDSGEQIAQVPVAEPELPGTAAADDVAPDVLGASAEAESEADAVDDLRRLDGVEESPAGSTKADGFPEAAEPAHAATADEPVEESTSVASEAPADGSASSDRDGQAPSQPKDETPAKRSVRPGMSLLDFATWEDDDRPSDQAEDRQPEAADASTHGGAVSSEDTVPEQASATTSVETSSEQRVEAEAAQPADTSAELERQPAKAPPLQTGGFVPSAYFNGAADKNGAETGLLEKLPVPVLIHSGDILHYANSEFLSLTGYASVEQLAQAGGIGVLFAEALDDEEPGDPGDRQLRLKQRGGQEFPVEAFLQSIAWQGGKALMLVLSRSTDRAVHLASPGQSPLIAELEARVAEMRTIIDTATDGVVLMSRDGTIRSISRPAEALFGFDSDEVAGKPFVSLFAIESQRAAHDYLNGLSDHGVASVLNDGREVIGREAEGRFIPLFMTIGKLPNDSGYCAVVRDITQWKRAEEELTQARALAERSSSQKSDFLARISHEIRTPLNAIIGFSELMVDERFGPVANDRYRDYLRDINRSGNHVLDLVNDLLDISKIEAGQQDMAYEAVSLNDTLAETVAMMQPQANRERVIIRSSFASKLPDVVADLRSVRQIGLNILSNAVRYTQAGGQVIVSTAYETSGDVVMRVRDTGIGMTQPEIEQALKPFKQINSLKRARGDGTGLGLPLTKALVEANRARFVITSTPGEGTLVEISFPSTRVLAD